MSKVLWMAGQAAAIAGLTYGMALEHPNDVAGFLWLNTILVAFLTAAIVNLLDWFRRPRALARAGQVKEPKRESLSPPAPSWFLGKPPQKAL